MREDLTVLKKLIFVAFTLFVALTIFSMMVIITKTLMGIDECEVKKENSYVVYKIPFKGTFFD